MDAAAASNVVETTAAAMVAATVVANVHTIFGSSIAGVHGKTICHKPEHVEVKTGCIPGNFHQLHQFVVLTADIMFVNGITFLTMLSQKLQLARVK